MRSGSPAPARARARSARSTPRPRRSLGRGANADGLAAAAAGGPHLQLPIGALLPLEVAARRLDDEPAPREAVSCSRGAGGRAVGRHLKSRPPVGGMSTVPVQKGKVEAVVVSFSPPPGRQLPSSLLPMTRKLSPSCVPSFLTRNVTLMPRHRSRREIGSERT